MRETMNGRGVAVRRPHLHKALCSGWSIPSPVSVDFLDQANFDSCVQVSRIMKSATLVDEHIVAAMVTHCHPRAPCRALPRSQSSTSPPDSPAVYSQPSTHTAEPNTS